MTGAIWPRALVFVGFGLQIIYLLETGIADRQISEIGGCFAPWWVLPIGDTFVMLS